jgi:alcohol dehydrogenase class IV
VLNVETFYNTADIKRFFFPGRIFWGKDCRELLHQIIPADKRLLIFVDIHFLDDPFIRDLRSRYASRILRVEPISSMPRTGHLRSIAEQLTERPDVIVSVGGGSTIDSAKAIIANHLFGTFDGVGMGQKRGMQRLSDREKQTFISLPTTPGTGADSSRYYVTYDSDTHGKVHGKSWELTADWILLDPYFVRGLSEQALVCFAFDAFVHFFESYLCRYERSWFGEMLSLDGMLRIVAALQRITGGRRDDDACLQLLYASTIAGVAISNVRTGSIHEAAGALLEHSPLTHPETLFVFLRTTYEQYRGHIAELGEQLSRSLRSQGVIDGIDSLEGLISWWENVFEKQRITDRIRTGLCNLKTPLPAVKQAIFDRVSSDKVWVAKESPREMNEPLVLELVDRSLSRFGIA